MSGEPVRVVVVDDSAAMRAMLGRMLEEDPAISVVGEAADANEARMLIRQEQPDVVTLDVEMPGMDGLTFLEKIMRLRPMPVVMCSTLTRKGGEIALEAMRLGAVDCVAKPSGPDGAMEETGRQLRSVVRAAARARVGRIGEPSSPAAIPLGADAYDGNALMAVGASTGGVEALFRLVGALPADCPPMLVVQHMPRAYTGRFAERLDRDCRVAVREAGDGDPLAVGTVLIAPGGERHMVLDGKRVRLVEGPLASNHRPSIDTLFHSVAGRKGPVAAAILTGMGRDGAEGLLAIRRGGGRTFAQSGESCVVNGMPRAAMMLGAAEREMDLCAMAGAMLKACRVRAPSKEI